MFRFSFFGSLFVFLFAMCTIQAEEFDFSVPNVIIVSNGDKQSAKSADYFFNHLSKRNRDTNSFRISRSDESLKSYDGNIIYFEIVPDLQFDYEVINKKGELSLFAKDVTTLKWLSYMLIDRLAADHDLQVSDLPPSYLDFKSQKVNFAFHYRDPHLKPNTDQDISGLLLTHNVDRDWGIWGHNFKKFFLETPDISSYALVDGLRDRDQYCFSSPKTFQAVKSYILDQHGRGGRDPLWFTIAPNDNKKVCTCSSCTREGNTARNATPAVVSLMNKLALEFPEDHFYTLAYLTTVSPPTQPLAKNTGVLVSTIDLSKAPTLNPSRSDVIAFSHLLNNWSKKTSSVYLWDYISNFDEYLTPFPVMMRVQEQLKYFKKLGVDGVFMNGSGYDYSPFEDIKTYVLSALMIDPSLSVESLVKRYCARFYPQSADLIASYVIDLENDMLKENRDIYIYSSFRKASQTYFNIDRFNVFYEDLFKLQPTLKGEEKQKVDQLLTAFAFVKLQIAYQQGSIENGLLKNQGNMLQWSNKYDSYLDRVAKASSYEILNYKEDKGALSSYLKEWADMKNKNYPTNRLVVDKALGLISGDKLEDASLLTNNIMGFVSDFHQGWFLSGEDIKLTGTLKPSKSQSVNLDFSFLVNKRHRMLPPDRIQLMADGVLIAEYNSADFIVSQSSVRLKKNLNLLNKSNIELRIFKNKEVIKSVIACDEILFY